MEWGADELQAVPIPAPMLLCWTGIDLEYSFKKYKRSLGCKDLVWLRVRVLF